MEKLKDFKKKLTVGAVVEAKAEAEAKKEPTPKYWLGSRVCNFCGMAYPQTLIDGTTVDGRWAIMCKECYKVFGVGLGIGLGQRYEWIQLTKEQGAYIKVEENEKTL